MTASALPAANAAPVTPLPALSTLAGQAGKDKKWAAFATNEAEPVERIRAEVLAGVGRASGSGAQARADSRECALSRHFAARLGPAGAGSLPKEPDGPDGPQLPPPDAP